MIITHWLMEAFAGRRPDREFHFGRKTGEFMVSFNDNRGFEELEKLLWQARVQESLAGRCISAKKTDTGEIPRDENPASPKN